MIESGHISYQFTADPGIIKVMVRDTGTVFLKLYRKLMIQAVREKCKPGESGVIFAGSELKIEQAKDGFQVKAEFLIKKNN